MGEDYSDTSGEEIEQTLAKSSWSFMLFYFRELWALTRCRQIQRNSYEEIPGKPYWEAESVRGKPTFSVHSSATDSCTGIKLGSNKKELFQHCSTFSISLITRKDSLRSLGMVSKIVSFRKKAVTTICVSPYLSPTSSLYFLDSWSLTALNQSLYVADYKALCAFQLAIFHLLSWMACFVTPSSSSTPPTTPLDIS